MSGGVRIARAVRASEAGVSPLLAGADEPASASRSRYVPSRDEFAQAMRLLRRQPEAGDAPAIRARIEQMRRERERARLRCYCEHLDRQIVQYQKMLETISQGANEHANH